MNDRSAHPYIPNTAPEARAAMLRAVGAIHVEDLYAMIPPELRLDRPLDLPPPLGSELELRRHVEQMLRANRSCADHLSFLGGGCWQHFVPAICDEVVARAEFLTAYAGDTYTDLGKYQAIFEFQSMLGELVGMEAVTSPTFDWAAAASSALMMAARITGRSRLLVPRTMGPERLAHLHNFALGAAEVVTVGYEPDSGLLDLVELGQKLDGSVAAVYLEQPTYLGHVEERAAEIAALARRAGALCVVGVDASTLGVLAAPRSYGADIVCGEAQPLGVHMYHGGGLCGFIATPDEERYVSELPSILVSLAPVREATGAGAPPADGGTWGFGWSTMARTSYDKRGAARDYTGTTQWLWGIAAAVYLALLGPRGMRELGEGMAQRSQYAARRLGELPGIRAPRFGATHIKEFVVELDSGGCTVAEVNRALLERGIFGGHDLSRDFPELGQTALYCVTEVHTRADVERLVGTLREVLA